MAKKNGKQAPTATAPTPAETQPAPQAAQASQQAQQTAQAQQAQQAQQAAATTAKKDNVFINRISEKMIRPVDKAKDGKDWTSVGFGVLMPDGTPAVGSVLVRSNQILPSTRKDAEGKTVPNPGFKNVLLGQPTQHYNVSLNVKGPDGAWMQQRMSAEEIRTAVDEANKAYRANRKKENQNQGRQGMDTQTPPQAPQADQQMGA